MFAVIGEWRMDPARGGDQAAGLEGIVAGVSQLPGLVAGYWTGAGGERVSRTFIVFEDRAGADRFATAVRGNLHNQLEAGVENLSLVVAEVVAHADPAR
ncbi:MAG: hypothetical protein JWP61_1569 [Friedmanniella sp.]|nr:hypothetical protein [Friedmanniella sp.]